MCLLRNITQSQFHCLEKELSHPSRVHKNSYTSTCLDFYCEWGWSEGAEKVIELLLLAGNEWQQGEDQAG